LLFPPISNSAPSSNLPVTAGAAAAPGTQTSASTAIDAIRSFGTRLRTRASLDPPGAVADESARRGRGPEQEVLEAGVLDLAGRDHLDLLGDPP
jgi:hypothetical protein